MAKSEKLDLNNLQNPSDFVAVAKAVENSLPKGAMLLDKGLLPSRGKFYSEEIYVKKLSTANIQALSTLNENNANYIFNTIITSCVFGIETNKIFVGDKLWLIYYLRSLTFDDLPFKLKHECENCGQLTILEYRLKNLKVSYLDEDLPPYIELKNGDKITIKFPTIGTEIQTNRLKNSEDIIEELNGAMLDFACNIETVNGQKMTIMKAYEYVSNMDGMDFSMLVNELSKYTFTVLPYAVFECPKCGEEVVEKIPFSPTFFLPKV